MKKKLVSTVCSFLLLCSVALTSIVTVNADDGKLGPVDGSYLTMEESSHGYTSWNPLLRGYHLMDGESAVSKAGKGKIYAYGSTTAHHDVDHIAVLVYVDRCARDENEWYQVDAWAADDENTYYVSTGKTLKVDGGYYYRVHCEHFAGNKADYPYDEDISTTNGIWID